MIKQNSHLQAGFLWQCEKCMFVFKLKSSVAIYTFRRGKISLTGCLILKRKILIGSVGLKDQ